MNLIIFKGYGHVKEIIKFHSEYYSQIIDFINRQNKYNGFIEYEINLKLTSLVK